MRDKLMLPNVLIAGLVLFVALLCVQGCKGQQSPQETARYRSMTNQLVFENFDELPFQILRPMCWNITEGWCDEGMDESGHRVLYLIDFETRQHGVVMENDSGCWLWWFLPEYGVDGQPHIAEDYWIECP